MIYQVLYKLFHKPQKKSGVAIKIGKAESTQIENNIAENIPLLEAEELINSTVKNNKTIFPSPKEIHMIWKMLLDLFFGLLLAYIIWQLGWN